MDKPLLLLPAIDAFSVLAYGRQADDTEPLHHPPVVHQPLIKAM